MIKRNTIKGYQAIVGQAALSLSMRTTATPDMIRYYEGQYGAYLHAARLLLDVNDQDSGYAYQDVQIDYQRLWAESDARYRAARRVHVGTMRESCESHGCAGCPSDADTRHGHVNPRVAA